MEIIDIDGKYYDPYYILNVTRNDDDEIVKSSFKKIAKKYHPDKAKSEKERIKFEKYFKILVKSYDYIKSKRSNSDFAKVRKESKQDNEVTGKKSDLQSSYKDPNDYGYGNHKRYENEDDYKNFEIQTYNQFGDKKYNNKEFNRIFEWNKKNTDDDSSEENDSDKQTKSTALIHKTTDGFFGYNTADVNSCALVNTYNGLLIVGDDFGESGVGYWDEKYGDYKLSYSKVNNPDKIIKPPKEFKTEFEKDSDKKIKKNFTKYNNIINDIKIDGDYGNEEKKLLDKAITDLEEKEKRDKKIVLKYINKYDNNIAKQGLEGTLDKNASYISVLKNKRIQ